MTVAVDQYGNESIVWAEITWGNIGPAIKYGDRAMSGILGGILSGATVSKTAKVGDSGVSKTCSLTLDDTDGALKAIYNTKVIEGSSVDVYQRFIKSDGITTIDQPLMSGTITSSISWNEGQRTLTVGCEDGSADAYSDKLGYAPIENAYATFNNRAIGKVWPIIFGKAAKVPGVRVEYTDDMLLEFGINISDATYEITNGDQLPQDPTAIQLRIGKLLFNGAIVGTTFTPTTKNVPYFVNEPIGARGIDVDATNPSVIYMPALFTGDLGGKFAIVDFGSYKFVNQITGRDPIDSTKWYCSLAWPEILTNTHQLDEVAGYPRVSWGTDYEVESGSGGSILKTLTAGGWSIPAQVPVYRITGAGYIDKYVVNLYPSTTVGEVWGKRTFFGREIWQKIPSSYYTVILSDTITTDPGAVVRNPTTLTFDLPLSGIECENWKDEIYVSVESTLTAVPKTLAQWVTDNFTSYTFDVAGSDSIPIGTNFAFFKTQDAFSFLQEYAWQVASVINVNGTDLRIQYLGLNPAATPAGRKHTVDKDLTIMKTVVLGSKAKEDIVTVVTAKYVTDYSGEDSADHEYVISPAPNVLGIQEKTYDFWALTCQGGVEGAANFWNYRYGQSWKTIQADLLIDASDIDAYHLGTFNYGVEIINNVSGLFESVVHETSSPHVAIKAELAVQAGMTTEDALYWTVPWGACAAPDIGIQSNYVVAQDDSCPGYFTLIERTTQVYNIVLIFWPTRIRRWQWFTIKAEIWNADDELALINTTADETILEFASPAGRDRLWRKGIAFNAGEYSGQFIFRGGVQRLTIPLSVKIISKRKDIRAGLPRKAPLQK